MATKTCWPRASAEKIDLIGNIMIDSFEMLRDKIEAANTHRTQSV